MPPMFTASLTPILLKGIPVPGAEDRQERIPGFDQAALSAASIVCIGAGGLISHIAPTLARKGVGHLTLIDHDSVEASNLNRQRFYPENIGLNKAIALARNLQRECIIETQITGIPLYFDEATEAGLDLSCDVAVCGVDNNRARVSAGRYFRAFRTPVIFTGVSASGDHGYVFVQGKSGACLGCVFPDLVNDDRLPCPGTPAVADILQLIGALAVYAVDTLLMNRPRTWSYRSTSISDCALDGCSLVPVRPDCPMFPSHDGQ